MAHWFLEEFKKLQDRQPRIALVASNSENSDYTNYAYRNKNCYLVFGGHYNEDALYCQYPYKAVSSSDCDTIENCELCYECVVGSNLYNCNYLYNCFSSSDCEFGFDLVNCQNCFLSCGLRNAQYHILNKPVPKEKYKNEVEILKRKYGTEGLMRELEKIRLTVPHASLLQKNCEGCLGSFLENCKDCFYCFMATNAQDCLYLNRANDIKDSVDCDNIGYDPSELLYECVGNSGNTDCNFCNACWHNSNLEYCELVFNSHHCFGCVSRDHAEYEILNVKYSKEDWEKKVAEIKDELRRENLYGKWLYNSTYPDEDTMATLYFR
ncbi:MAG: hypothetical protein AAB588_06615 [Patescibacteria group bacterium]